MNNTIKYYTDITEYVKMFEVFDKDFCNETIDIIKDLQWDKHTYYDVNNNSNHSYHDDLYVLSENVYPRLIIEERLWYSIRAYIEYFNHPWNNTWQGYTSPRFNKYPVDSNMKIHCDHIHSIFPGTPKGVPILTCLGQLNTEGVDFEGGELYICNEKLVIPPGNVVVFPSNFLFPHEVRTVTSGTRYSFVSWVY